MKDLLLLLSHYPFDTKNREALQLMLRRTDWEETVRLINAHGIIALAANNIKEAGLKMEIPREPMSILENGLIKNIARNCWLIERWKEVNTILSGAGIKHVLLKGMALEHTVYDSRGLRQMTDNDIFIEPSRAEEAFRLLISNGFIAEPEKSKLFRKICPYPGKHLPELTKNGYTIEIHTHLPGIDTSSIRKIVTEIMIDHKKALILKDEFHIKYLREHFIRHAAEGNCQVRMFNDLIMLQNDNFITFPDEYVYEPDQSWKTRYRKMSYKLAVNSIPSELRLLYIAGDIFPSINWMQKRYNCGKIMAFLYYPLRILKLFRLL